MCCSPELIVTSGSLFGQESKPKLSNQALNNYRMIHEGDLTVSYQDMRSQKLQPAYIQVAAPISVIGHIVYRKCDTGQSSGSNGSGNQRIHDVDSRDGTAGGNGRSRENYLLELRLRWAIRRLQEHIRVSIQRRCELRLCAILRMQYAFRTRLRVRAATVIQRFARRKFLWPTFTRVDFPLNTSMLE